MTNNRSTSTGTRGRGVQQTLCVVMCKVEGLAIQTAVCMCVCIISTGWSTTAFGHVMGVGGWGSGSMQ